MVAAETGGHRVFRRDGLCSGGKCLLSGAKFVEKKRKQKDKEG